MKKTVFSSTFMNFSQNVVTKLQISMVNRESQFYMDCRQWLEIYQIYHIIKVLETKMWKYDEINIHLHKVVETTGNY